ncbi:MAG TPA: ABC transporter substrate-binding protein [Streptosporangiaceae bacterium]|nr:ABC transporter substrate-binding protein [Streptosporangiaceae bacterium]
MRRAQLRYGGLVRRRKPGNLGQPGRSAIRRRATLGCAALLAIGVTAAGCGTVNRSHIGNTPVAGGSVTFALPANVEPNYIFPFTPAADFTIVNLDNLQYLLWRPLYWWGDNGLPYLNKKLSLALEPRYHGQVVTIKLKHGIRWTDGSTVTAKNIMFWMNMMKSLAHTEWGGYIPGGIPDNVTNVHAVGTDEVQMTIKGKYSSAWFTGNELSQITPLPLSWDRTSSGAASDCAEHASDCPAVFRYLNSLASVKSTWATQPLWKDIDGPWQLTGYSTQGVLTFSRNPKYSLSVPKDHITQFIEQPYTSEEAEFNVLQAGGAHPLDVGYLPTVDAPVPPPGAQVGQNPVAGYRMQPVYTWGLSYIPYNFGPADPQVAIFNQLYFRQAFQLLVNQPAIVQGALHGYGKVETGPVGDAPPTKYLSPTARKGDPFPFNLGRARKLLTDNGWDVNAEGVTECGNPGSAKGQCGAGVKGHQKLVFDMLVATGNAWVEAAVLQLKSNASLVGIKINTHDESFDQVITTVENICGTPTHVMPCPWELADWGEGWSYVPDYLPTGDELFGTGSGGNIGHFSDKTNDRLIAKTLQTPSLKAMYKWEDYLTQRLPVVLQPTAPAALIESVANLHIGRQSPTLAITPEDWYYVR